MATLCGVLVLYSCYLLQRIRAGISFLKGSFYFLLFHYGVGCRWRLNGEPNTHVLFILFVFSFVCVWLWDHSGERLCRPLLTYAVEWLSRKHVCFSLRQTVLSSPSAPNYCWRHICWFFWLLSFFSYSFRFLCVCVVVQESFFCSVFFIQEKKTGSLHWAWITTGAKSKTWSETIDVCCVKLSKLVVLFASNDALVFPDARIMLDNRRALTTTLT